MPQLPPIPRTPRTSFATNSACFFTSGNRVEKRERCTRPFHGLPMQKFNHLIGYAIHIPLAALVEHQGGLVSVMWMLPLLSEDPMELPEGSLLQHMVGRLESVLLVSAPPHAHVPLYRGGDARNYVGCVNEVLCHPLDMLHRGIDTSRECRIELIHRQVEPTFQPDLGQYIRKVLAPRVGPHLVRAIARMPSGQSVYSVLVDGIVARVLHANGINMTYVFCVATSPGSANGTRQRGNARLSPSHWRVS